MPYLEQREVASNASSQPLLCDAFVQIPSGNFILSDNANLTCYKVIHVTEVFKSWDWI